MSWSDTSFATPVAPRDTSNILVWPATYQDIPSMISILHAYLIKDINALFNLTPQEILAYQDKGLFITPFDVPTSSSQPEASIDASFGRFTVAQELGEVLWYVVGYPIDQYVDQHPSRQPNVSLLAQLDGGRTDRIFYGKHIGVTPDRTKAKWVMRKMGDYFFDNLKQEWFAYVIGEVLSHPFENTQSLNYCKLTGHTIIGEISYPNGTKRHLVAKKLNG